MTWDSAQFDFPAWVAEKRIENPRPIIDSTVTDMDIQRSGAQGEATAASLLRGFAKWPAIASSRNAVAVASLGLRVMTSEDTSFRKRSLKRWQLDRIRSRRASTRSLGVGHLASKALDMAENVVEITDQSHPLVSLLRQVNPHMNGFDLLEQTEIFLGMTGDAFWSLVQSSGAKYPTEIWPLMPQYTQVVPDENDLVRGYLYGRDRRNMLPLKAEDVIHFKRPNPFDPFRGYSDLQKIIDDANLSIKFTQIAAAMVDNGVRPGGIVVAPDAGKETARDMENALNAKHSGPEQAGKWMVLWGDSVEKIEQFKFTEREVQFLQSDERMREIIAAAFDMPVELLTLRPGGLADGGNSRMTDWQRFGVLPRAQRIEDKLNERLVPLFAKALGDPGLFLVFDSPVEEDEDRVSVRVGREWDSGIRKRNEARIAVGLEPDPDGDVYKELEQADPFESFGVIEPVRPSLPEVVPATGQDVEVTEDLVLNGAQIAAATNIVAAVAAGEIPRSAGIGQLEILFNLSPEQAERIMGSAGTSEPTTPNPRPTEPSPSADHDAPPVLDGKSEPGEPAGAWSDWSSWWWKSEPAPDQIRTKGDDERAARAVATPERRLAASIRDWLEGAIPDLVASVGESEDYTAPDLGSSLRSALVGPMEEAVGAGVSLGEQEVAR